jgi:hypothetical protein
LSDGGVPDSTGHGYVFISRFYKDTVQFTWIAKWLNYKKVSTKHKGFKKF